MRNGFLLLGLVGIIGTSTALGAPAPSRERQLLSKLSFREGGKTWSAIDIESYHLTYRFSVKDHSIAATAVIRFTPVSAGRPYFFMTPEIGSVRLNGARATHRLVSDPEGINTYVGIDTLLKSRTTYELEVTFEVGSAEFNVPSSGGVGFLVSFTDVSKWKFLNRYAPGNFESDQFALTWDLELADTTFAQKIFANGSVSELESRRRWRVEFPAHYTSSSFFLHFTSEAFTVERLEYAGLERRIPIVLYSKSASLVADAKKQILDLFRELEGDYGPYAHDQFIAYLSSSGGGMEYCGATITSLGAMDHELLHSWFARGVMPAEGRSGWFDEAIASWRDYGYKRERLTLSRDPTNLASYSIFQANTAGNSYVDGRAFMAELDGAFADRGGYKSVIREFFAKYKRQVVTTELYLDFVQKQIGTRLKPYTDRFVYGKGERRGAFVAVAESLPPGKGHPPAITFEEERALR